MLPGTPADVYLDPVHGDLGLDPDACAEDDGLEPESPPTSWRRELWNMVLWALVAAAITAVFGMVLNFLEWWL